MMLIKFNRSMKSRRSGIIRLFGINLHVAWALLIFLAMTGCKSGEAVEESQTSSTGNAAADPALSTLTVLTNRVDLIENGVLAKYAAQFESKHAGIKVEFEGLTNYASDIMVRLSTRNMGDALLVPNNLTNQDLVNYFEPLPNSMFNHIRFADFKSFRGTRYGIVTGASTEGIVYSKPAFRRAGITNLPTTLTSFYEDCENLLKAGIVPIDLNYGAQWPMSVWGENLVGYMTGDSGYLNRMTTVDNPWKSDNSWGHAMNIVRTLIQKGYVEPNLFENNWEESKREFAKGKVGMLFIGNWVINQIIEAGGKSEDIGFIPFPYDDEPNKRYAQLSPDWFLGVSKFSEHKELAKQWVDFFVHESGYVNESGFLPVDETKISSMPQIQQFESYHPDFVERQSPSDDFLNIAAKAEIAFWSGDYVQEWSVAKSLESEFKTYNDRWQTARHEVLGTRADAKSKAETK